MRPSYLFTLTGHDVVVSVTDKLSIDVIGGNGVVIWSSSVQMPPKLTLSDGQVFNLHESKVKDVFDFTDSDFTGYRIRIANFGNIDVEIDLVLALDTTDTLLIYVEQIGGEGTVLRIDQLFRIEKPTVQGGYMVLPHGSGYLVDSDCAEELPGTRSDTDLIGARWTLPMFGMVRGDNTLFIIVEDWWDCEVKVEHKPDLFSAIEFNWIPSLGSLNYPRKMTIQFTKNMDHVGMAKAYRKYAQTKGMIRTLEEKAEDTPVLRRYFNSILVRWHTNNNDRDRVMSDLRRFREIGFNLIFFYPKWESQERQNQVSDSVKDPSRGTWHAFLQPNPGGRGWQYLVGIADEARSIGCVVHVFTRLISHDEGAPGFDSDRLPRDKTGNLTNPVQDAAIRVTHDEYERFVGTLDFVEERGFKIDCLYFDGYAAHSGLVEDFSESHPVSRRLGYELMNKNMGETRSRGMMPAAEVGRFWCIQDADFFFFTDWARERLTNTPTTEESVGPVGIPVPLFQLVFHDCCMAGFSGGGYTRIREGCDWWSDQNPRLYEMLFASAPAYNWLPTSELPVDDWDSDLNKSKIKWLKRWSAYFNKIATSEMASHSFLSEDRKVQRIEFANGVWAEFDFHQGMCRVSGVDGFTGRWESPADDLGPYSLFNQ